MFTLLLFSIIMAPILKGTEDTRIPNHYQGVWKIVAAVDEDGSESSSDEAGFAEKYPIEILIVGNRIIHVKNDGSTVLAYATVLTSDHELTLDLRTGIAHDKENSPTYWNLRLNSERLTIELAIDLYDEDPRTDRTAVPSFQAVRVNR